MDILLKKAVSGFGWLGLINFSNRILGFLTTLILAKLLAPEEFGLVAIASMLVEGLQIFKDMGLSEAIIYRKKEIEKACNTAFVMVILLNSILFLISIITAPIAGVFFGNKLVTPIIILMASNLIWNGISTIPSALIRKSVDFKKLVFPNVVSNAASSVISIGMALNGFGVWSLVAKTMIGSALAMVWVWKIAPYRPTLKFDKYIAKELMKYGKFIVGSSIVLVTLYNIDKFYVSKTLGIIELGIYELAIRIVNMPVSELSHLVGAVMFPVLSTMNSEKERFKETFLKTLKFSSMISIPMAIGIFAFGPPLVKYLYGEKWMMMAIPLQILSIYALFRSLSTIIHDGFKALGRADLLQKVSIARLAIIGSLGIPVLLVYGLNGICYLLVCTYLVVLFIEVKLIGYLISTSLFEIANPIFAWIGISSLIVLAAYWGGCLLPGLSQLTILVLEIAFVVIAYGLLMFLMNKDILLRLK